MSDQGIRNLTPNEPDWDDNFDLLRNEIFIYLNCIRTGVVESFSKAEQTVSVKLQEKRKISDTEIVDYPLLVDCPVAVLQGGGAFLDFPIAKGDFCIVLFNDTDIDNWWTTGNVKEPNTGRKHSLSDGIAIIGLNTKISPLDLDGTNVVLNATGKKVKVKGSSLDLLGASESFLKGTTWKTNWTIFNASVQAATPTGTSAQNAAAIEAIKAAFVVFAAQLSNMISATIKGE